MLMAVSGKLFGLLFKFYNFLEVQFSKMFCFQVMVTE